MKHKELLQIAVKRLEICNGCEHLFQPTKSCKKCGCFMLVKTKVPFAECPQGKWDKMSAETQESTE